jgi:ClpP class serine protease
MDKKAAAIGIPNADSPLATETNEKNDIAVNSAVSSQKDKQTPIQPKPVSKITPKQIVDVLIVSLQPDAKSEKESTRDQLIRQYLRQDIPSEDVINEYNLLILHDESMMVKRDADFIYSASTSFKEKKPILLVLYSGGGVIGSAYLIGQLCREYSKEKFVISVPRQAKSAATLLCCAADEIHMGSLSELGPIDPQIDDLPALGLKASVTHICDLVKENPHASKMFAEYLSQSLDPVQLGYYERVAESAAQYAERLHRTHTASLKNTPAEIAKTLVYSYKDHGFVIDKSEALNIFGDKTIKINTPEYSLGNYIYEKLNFISQIASVLDHRFYFIGSLDSQLHFTKTTS